MSPLHAVVVFGSSLAPAGKRPVRGSFRPFVFTPPAQGVVAVQIGADLSDSLPAASTEEI